MCGCHVVPNRSEDVLRSKIAAYIPNITVSVRFPFDGIIKFLPLPPDRGKENYRGEIIRQCSFLSMTDSEREDTYIRVGEDFEQHFYRATSMNDVCTSVQLNSLLNRASELFDGNGGFDEPWNSLGLAIVGAWNLSSRLSIRSNDIQPYCAPYKEGNSTVNMYRVRRYFRYLPFIQGNRMACLFFEHIRYDTVFPSCRG